MALDPILDVQSLDHLTKPDRASGVGARLHGLLAVLTRVGLDLPAGLVPGDPIGRLCEVPGTGRTPTLSRGKAADGPRRARIGRGRRLTPWLPWSGAPKALAQSAAGLPPAAWVLRDLSGGRLTSGALRPAHGALGLSYDLTHPRDGPP
ncbi:hypothetical protein [Streptomyces canus]|uniref:hypothetical protein n=1 Tax=Streptomyces canus TaxID=58343 RepID=UPI001ABFE801|nr:hypothetical protein [Streptomyces canus]